MRAAISVVVIVCFLQTQLRAAPSGAKHFKAGQAAFDAENYERAIVEYKAALAIDAAPEYLFHLGQAFRMKREKKTALDYYRRYLEIAPTGPSATQAKVYIASLTLEVEEEARSSAPPPPPPPIQVVAPPPPVYTPPPIYDRKLMKQRLSICVDGPADWAFCGYKQRTIGENAFIRRYHAVTGRAELDDRIDPARNRTQIIIAGGLTAGFALLAIIGWAVFGAAASDGKRIGDPSGEDPALTAGLALGSIGSTGLGMMLILGWPLALREPRTRHNLSKERAQAAVDEYNDALVRPFQRRAN